MAISGSLLWRRHEQSDVSVASVEEGLFFRICPAGYGGYDLWLIRRVDHRLGGLHSWIGWFASNDDAEAAATSQWHKAA
jgi:hypothetical protein